MAALAQDYRQPEPFEVPEGGLASFLTATTGEWAEATNDDYIPETGIAGVKAVADKLAEYGRYEDEYMVHAAEGETVIPAQVLDLNPRLKAKLFKEMRDMGLEPERYVVGNELNSINPVTGQPEFFLKKLFKGIKKAVKKVVKVLKKASTVVLPIVGGMLGGPLGAALGSGIATAIQGGNLKDVLKSAAISGLTAGVFQAGQAGFQAASAGSATGLGNVGEFFAGAGQNISSGLSGGYADQFGQMVASLGGGAPDPSSSTYMQDIGAGEAADLNLGTDTLTSPRLNMQAGLSDPSSAVDLSGSVDSFGSAERAAQLADLGVTPEMQAAAELGPDFGMARRSEQLADLGVTPEMQQSAIDARTQQAATGTQAATEAATGSLTSNQLAGAIDSRGFFTSVGDAFGNLSQGDFSEFFNDLKQAFLPQNYTAENLREFALNTDKYKHLVANTDFEALAQTLRASSAAPGMMRTYLPLYGLGVGAMYATGGFETPEFEPEMPFGGQTGSDLREQFPGLYDPGVFRYAPVRTAAGGGDITHFPRRNGAIYGPGTETSDDIPAMLSDGEFVMTARAVRGAGNGDRELGMQRMYDIMRRFEGGAIRG